MRGPSLFLLFELDYLSEHSHSHTGWILLIPQNLSCYLHFAFCLFVCLIQLKTIRHSSHHRTASGDHSYYWEAERGDLEAWIARGPNLKWGWGGGGLGPLFIPCPCSPKSPCWKAYIFALLHFLTSLNGK